MRSPNYSKSCAFSHQFYRGSVLFQWINGSGKLFWNISQFEEVLLCPGKQGDSPWWDYIVQDTVTHQKQRLLQYLKAFPRNTGWAPGGSQDIPDFSRIWWLCYPTAHYGRNSCFHNSTRVSHVQKGVSCCSFWPCGMFVHQDRHQQQYFHLSFIFYLCINRLIHRNKLLNTATSRKQQAKQLYCDRKGTDSDLDDQEGPQITKIISSVTLWFSCLCSAGQSRLYISHSVSHWVAAWRKLKTWTVLKDEWHHEMAGSWKWKLLLKTHSGN